MKFFIKKMLSWIVGGVVIVILSIIGVIWYINSNQAPSFGTVTVIKGNIVQSLSETGNVLAENKADLSFQEAGQIANINVKEGDTVSAGTVIAKLDTSSLETNFLQAQAGLQVAQAKLQDLENGTRPEQILVYQNTVSQAQSALNSAIASLSVAQSNAYVASEDAVDNQSDNLFTNPKYSNPIFLVTIADSQMTIDIQSKRVAIGELLNNWYNLQNFASYNPAQENATINSYLQKIQSYLDELAIAVNNSIQNSISASTISAYKAYVLTARNEVAQNISALTNASNAMASAISSLSVAQSQLVLAQSGATQEQIDAQKAAVAQAQAVLDSAQVAINHASLIAPFSGIVRNKNMDIGQVVNAGVPVISMTNDSGLKVETYVSQSDIAKIGEGDNANITLDAYGNGVVFQATVTNIDSAGTQVNGNISYKVTLHFKNYDSRVKPGMTANINIIIAESDNTLEISSNLIITDGNQNFVLVKNGKNFEKRQVTIGIVGDNGLTEILSGLKEGDKVTNF
jgi:HlyD family secretion protein